MTEELTDQQLSHFIDGYQSARADWGIGQPYAQYLPTRPDYWRDGYAFFIRYGRYPQRNLKH